MDKYLEGEGAGPAKGVGYQNPLSFAPLHTEAALHASPPAQHCTVLRRVVEQIENSSHHPLLTFAKTRERLQTERVVLCRMMVDRVCPTMTFINAIQALRGALR